ncbi:hypothetical protein [Streptomyces jumonjinensis]|uniref:hypothetical protein n=1 Tax=Streptomyces jumonjinensis TaxID=1945 RepID=UPI00378DB05E
MTSSASPEWTLRDLADAWHACAALGLTSPTAAVLTEGYGLLFAAIALAAGRTRPALTVTATTTITLAASHLIH